MLEDRKFMLKLSRSCEKTFEIQQKYPMNGKRKVVLIMLTDKTLHFGSLKKIYVKIAMRGLFFSEGRKMLHFGYKICVVKTLNIV
jgi:hypothetical protein